MTNGERWLRRFARGAATAYAWEVFWYATGEGPRRVLRARFPEGKTFPGELCPLTMQQHYDGFPSMLGADMVRIMAAADDAPDAEAALRTTLLQLCHVEDLAPTPPTQETEEDNDDPTH